MSRLYKIALLASLALVTGPLSAQTSTQTSGAPRRTPAAQTVDAAAVHQRATVIDGHVDVLLPSTPRRYYLPDGGDRADLARLTQGGVDAVVLSLAVGPGPRDAAGVRAARAEVDQKLQRIQSFVASNPQRVAIARSADDVERLTREGKVAIILGFQNARSIGSDIAQIDTLYQQGVRIFAFNHAGHNDWSDSSRPQNEAASEHGGLSELGRRGVARLNDLGILIDVSQQSDQATLQTIRLSRAPVAATHSAARALIDNTRNLSDAELDAIKANGGIVQVPPFTGYLITETAAAHARVTEVRRRYGLSETWTSPYDGAETLTEERRDAYLNDASPVRDRATLSNFVDHIDYIARRIGWQHVGIGTDFNHGSGVVDFNSEAEAPNVTAELLRRGYTEEQIRGIWGDNFLRVLRAAEAARRT